MDIGLSNLLHFCLLLRALPPWFVQSLRYSPCVKDHYALHHLEKGCQILVGICNTVIYLLIHFQAVHVSALIVPPRDL